MPVRPAEKKRKDIPTFGKPSLPENQMTAAKRSKMSEFIQLCQDKGVQPTKRQAAKYNAGRNRWARSRVLES